MISFRFTYCAPQTRTRYVTSSLFLMKAWKYLTSDPEKHERMLLITGAVAPDGTNILSDMQFATLAKKSATYVMADPHLTAIQLHRLVEINGHQLHAMWHSHIMRGQASSQPSETDLKHQQRLVQIGMTKTLGGIFTIDGYCRFFSTAIDFELTLYGEHVTMLDDQPRDKVFKLNVTEEVNALAYQTE